MVIYQNVFNKIFKDLGLPEDLAIITLSQRPELSDYQINGSFSGAKILKQSPSIIAQKIIDLLPQELLNDFEVSQTNGFINLKIKDSTLINSLSTNLDVSQKQAKVIIDFSGPNIAKSMHVGHVRSTLIGQALVNFYKYQGNSVIADNHIGDFGTINGPDNKPFKTRSGGVLKLSDLINSAISKAQEKIDNYDDSQKLGLGALKFGELKHNRKSDYVFDLDKFLDLEGYTGPYVMYAAVRGQSVLNKTDVPPKLSTNFYSIEEKSLALALSQFTLFFNLALKNHEPHVLCEYSYNLASKFNSFYHAHNILKEPNQQVKEHRLALTLKTVETLTKALDLLGIEIPSKM